MKIVKIILIATTSLYLSACAALTPSKQTISITSNVNDAKIIVNGKIVGIGNTTTQVIRNKNVNIMTIKEGYIPAVHTINKHNNIQGILDAFTCGFGLVVLLFRGAFLLLPPRGLGL